MSTGELHEMQAEADGNPSESRKRLVEIPEDVLDVFKTDGETDQARGNFDRARAAKHSSPNRDTA